MTKHELIAQLQLEHHTEGGYFRRTYTAPLNHRTRALMSSIYYLLTDDSPIGHLHRNRSDILHYWQAGHALRYTLIDPEGYLHTAITGPDLDAGQRLQLLVPGGWWKASELLNGEYGLISEAVCPGFDFADHEMAKAATIKKQYPELWHQVSRLCKP